MSGTARRLWWRLSGGWRFSQVARFQTWMAWRRYTPERGYGKFGRVTVRRSAGAVDETFEQRLPRLIEENRDILDRLGDE
jgi:hypothetical protein